MQNKDWLNIETFPTKDNKNERPMKMEFLYPDGRVGKIIIFGNASEAHLRIDNVCMEGVAATHWRAI